MQIFCDESGGSDASNQIFLVAASYLTRDPARLLKSFKKATALKGEIKGHSLTPDQRRLFFQLLGATGAVNVVIVCRRKDVIGGWAMARLKEARLYRYLLQEACASIPWREKEAITITPDGGRYKKAQLSEIERDVQDALAPTHERVFVRFEDSKSVPGLQIADVVANSVFQMLGSSARSEIARAILQPLIETNVIAVRDLRLEISKPSWFDMAR